jgi:hypothetical protein
LNLEPWPIWQNPPISLEIPLLLINLFNRLKWKIRLRRPYALLRVRALPNTRFSLPGDDEEDPFDLDTELLTLELFSRYCKEDMEKAYNLVVETALHRDHLLDRLEEVLPQALQLT